MTMFATAACILLSSLGIVYSALLRPLPGKPCTARYNASFVDLSSAFEWPVTTQAPGFGGFYSYEYDCAGYRTTCGKGVTVCQLLYGGIPAGGSPDDAIWLADSFNVPSSLRIIYPTSLLRASHVYVTLNSSTNAFGPRLSKLGRVEVNENPPQEYNFDMSSTWSIHHAVDRNVENEIEFFAK